MIKRSSNPERISNIDKYTDRYSSKSSFQLYAKEKEVEEKIIGEIKEANISKSSSKWEYQIILIMITDQQKRHYLAVTSLSALLREITSTQYGDFYYSNCLNSSKSENKLNLHKTVHRYLKYW